jgi:hypothetical protein
MFSNGTVAFEDFGAVAEMIPETMDLRPNPQDYEGTIPLTGGGLGMGGNVGGANNLTVPPVMDEEPEEMRTQFVRYDGEVVSKTERRITGWLVCVDGPEKGKDFHLFSENNFIGRGPNNDVRLNDPTVSSDKHAVVIYDPEERIFSFGLFNGSGIVRLNGKRVTRSDEEIKLGDRLKIGQGTYMFVPLCGDNFQWED